MAFSALVYAYRKAVSTAAIIRPAKYLPFRLRSAACTSDQSPVNFPFTYHNLPPLPSPSIRKFPWLMLPPALEGQAMVHKFYSPAENQVLSVPKRAGGGGGEDAGPAADAICVGSSHGWLFYMNRPNGDLFLSDPLSPSPAGRHIKLPCVSTVLSRDPSSFADGGAVCKIIISSPNPDDESCRVGMISQYRLAVCCPGHPNAAWTRFGSEGNAFNRFDLTYSSKNQQLYSLIRSTVVESWDLRDPSSPRRIPMADVIRFEPGYSYNRYRPVEDLGNRLVDCFSLPCLVEHDGDLFLLLRFVIDRDSGEEKNLISVPNKTVDFDVFRFDSETSMWRYMDRSLDGLAFFVGYSHNFAVPLPPQDDDHDDIDGTVKLKLKLKPNSIYFTDEISIVVRGVGKKNDLGYDIGVFDYANKTVSPCYYPCDIPSIRPIEPAPMWFNPAPPLDV